VSPGCQDPQLQTASGPAQCLLKLQHSGGLGEAPALWGSWTMKLTASCKVAAGAPPHSLHVRQAGRRPLHLPLVRPLLLRLGGGCSGRGERLGGGGLGAKLAHRACGEAARALGSARVVGGGEGVRAKQPRHRVCGRAAMPGGRASALPRVQGWDPPSDTHGEKSEGRRDDRRAGALGWVMHIGRLPAPAVATCSVLHA